MEYHTRDAVITRVFQGLRQLPNEIGQLDLDDDIDRKAVVERVDELLRVFVPESFTGIHSYDPTRKVLSLSWTGSSELIRVRMETVVEVAMGASEPLAWSNDK